MSGGFGGMLSIQMAGGAGAARDVLAAVRVFKRATSLGGVESLIADLEAALDKGAPR